MTNLDAKVSALIAGSDVPGAASAPDAADASPPTSGPSGAESASGAPDEGAVPSAASPGSPPEASTNHDLLREKLAAVRAQNRDRREAGAGRKEREAAQRDAERMRAEAKAERDAAAAEKAKWERIGKDSSFLDGLRELGRDPRAEFEKMQREAIEAGTPEAQLKAVRAAFEKQLADEVAPLKKTIEELTEREKRAQMDAAERGFQADFAEEVKGEDYTQLRIEYPEERLFAIARNLRDNPEAFYAEADRLNVSLTDPDRGFTMRDILSVLKSAQDEHHAGVEKRRTSTAAPSEAAQNAAATSRPTVNGTAAPRNAGASTIGNDLATARAADGKFIPQGSTAAQRIRERVRKLGGG